MREDSSANEGERISSASTNVDATLDHTLDMLERIAAGSQLDSSEVAAMRRRLLSVRASDREEDHHQGARKKKKDGAEGSDGGDGGDDGDDESTRGKEHADAEHVYDEDTAAWLVDMVRPETDTRSLYSPSLTGTLSTRSSLKSPSSLKSLSLTSPLGRVGRTLKRGISTPGGGTAATAGGIGAGIMRSGSEDLAGGSVEGVNGAADPGFRTGGEGRSSSPKSPVRPICPELKSPFCPIGLGDLPPRYTADEAEHGGDGNSRVAAADFTSPRTSTATPPRIPQNLSTSTMNMLELATSEWSWNAFSFAAELDFPLATFAMYLLRQANLVAELDLEEEALERFLIAVDKSYAAPYMNPSDVAVAAHRSAKKTRVRAPRGAGLGFDRGTTNGGETASSSSSSSTSSLLSSGGGGGPGGDVGGGVSYHNVAHACDVLQSTYAYLYLGGLAAALNPRQQLVMLLAAVVHDVGHPGLNNDFFNKTNAAIAHRYFGKSVLENYHASTAFSYLNDPDHQFLCNWNEGDVVELYESIVMLVLSTDMKRHFEHIKTLKTHVEEAKTIAAMKNTTRRGEGRRKDELPTTKLGLGIGSRNSNSSMKSSRSVNALCSLGNNECPNPLVNRPPRLIVGDNVMEGSTLHNTTPRGIGMNGGGGTQKDDDEGGVDKAKAKATVWERRGGMDGLIHVENSTAASSSATIEAAITNDDVRMSLMVVALKAADLGHLARPTSTHRNWVEALQEEFWMQGDREIRLGMQAIPMFNRFAGERIGASQVGFIEVVALPLFVTLVEAMPYAEPQLDAVTQNRDFWTKYQEAGKYKNKWMTAAKLSSLMRSGSAKDGLRLSSNRSGMHTISSNDSLNERSNRGSARSFSTSSSYLSVEQEERETAPMFDPRSPGFLGSEEENLSASFARRESRFSSPDLVIHCTD